MGKKTGKQFVVIASGAAIFREKVSDTWWHLRFGLAAQSNS